ncbi:FAD-dependent oxidoreductase [Lentzea sp. NBRC 105346]|uniref:NAD(P)/FAD-dependent oxidoreductase n=1 Tax=Lentzea sp. NBRC 105346 TaxID=3032205 RepID=UPI00249FE678|nr:NAD(P)/FAD-dependent oxidoreductase [Lentzea sp. NBRC 105346]GLZ28580.1 FAD-dependent oxidoreductase [Lentzea sp. NBRC 105346]
MRDAIIVGARPAGAATALLLARAGLDVLVVDRGSYGTDTLSTHALMRGGVLQLARWGLLDRIVAAGTPPVRRTTFRYAGAEVPITIKPSPGVDALYAPRRTLLDPILVDAAREAGAEVRYGTTVTNVIREDDTVTGVAGRTRDGQPFQAKAKIVIGADGFRSTIADLVHAPFDRVGRSVAAVTYGYWTGLRTDGYEWNFRPGAASGVIPTNDGQACVYASGPPRHIGRGGLDILTRIVALSSPGLAKRLEHATPPRSLRTFTGQRAHLRRARGPGWALVGDAGYFKDPLSAHGITDALRDAELLARSILDGTDYQGIRDALSIEMFDVMDVIAGHRWTDDEIPELLLRLNAAMSDEIAVLNSYSLTGTSDSSRATRSRRPSTPAVP